MAQVTYRKLDENHDPQWGNGVGSFISDFDAVAQAIETRLLLFKGEWWENLLDGLPLWQKILGIGGVARDLSAVNLLIQQRIMGTPFVTGIQNIQSSYVAGSRKINFYCEVLTQFGTVTVSNYPVPPNRSLDL